VVGEEMLAMVRVLAIVRLRGTEDGPGLLKRLRGADMTPVADAASNGNPIGEGPLLVVGTDTMLGRATVAA